jgi:cytochrome c biogenesis protein CcmG/thiol:disulfide interchange protein DsbE
MKKLIQYIPFLLILCVASVLFIKVNMEGKDAGDSLFGEEQMTGKKVADYALDKILPANNPGKIDQGSYKGRYTVINLFASWCTACLYEHKFVKGLKDIKGVNVIGIAWRDKKEDALDWLAKNGDPYNEVGLDNQGKFGILMGVTGIPETFLIDKNGIIIKHYARTITEDDIKEIREQIK